MNRNEQELLDTLLKLAISMPGKDNHWASILIQKHNNGERLFKTDTPVKARFEFVQNEVEKLFTGMGSLKNILLPVSVEKTRETLYQQTQSILKDYWKALGRESHDPGEFTPYPVGTRVKMVKGKICLVYSDGRFFTVPDDKSVDKQIWTIESQSEPDITNMPQYTIQRGSIYRNIRHDAICSVNEENPS